jgi:hypothetical protein
MPSRFVKAAWNSASTSQFLCWNADVLGDSTMPSMDFEERATECIKLAEATENFRDREFYLMLASAWRGLADVEDDDLWQNQTGSRH